MESNSKKLFLLANRAYEYWGKPIPSLGDGFTSYLLNEWLFPTNSPIYLNKTSFTEDKSQRLIKFFRGQKRVHEFANKNAYFCFNRSLLKPTKKFKNSIKKLDWKKTDSSYQLCIWKRVLPIQLPNGFTYVVGRYSDKKLEREARGILNNAFQTPSSFFLRANKTILPYNNSVLLAIIYDPKGKPVAAGAASYDKQSSFLFSGARLR